MKHTLLIITALMLVVGCSNVNGQTYTGMEFYETGEPKSIKTYKVSKDKIELVKEIMWYKNGQKRRERTYKDGKQNGKATGWYENGQKSDEGTYKKGEYDGKWTYWSGGEAGGEVIFRPYHKSSEGTYKDGKIFEWTSWDSDGNKR